MKGLASGLLLTALLLSTVAPPLLAQTGALDADLYFPPELEPHTSGEYLSKRIAVTTIPLLPMIFFDAPGNAVLPERYRGEAEIETHLGLERVEHGIFVDLEDPGSVLDPHYESLKIIALRLKRFKTAEITLTGRYSDEPGETSEVADQRAASVRDFIVRWGEVEAKRIHIEPAVPFLPTAELQTSNVLDIYDEARRVDIRANQPEILDDLVVYLLSIEAKTFDFSFSLTHRVDPAEIASVDFDSFVDGEELGRVTWYPSEERESYRFEGEWHVPGRALSRRPFALIVKATLRMRDNSMRVADPMVVPIEFRRFTPSTADEFRIPDDRRPEGSDDRNLGTLFFDQGVSTMSATQGIGIEGLMKRAPRGRLHLLVYHPVDPEGAVAEPIRDDPASVDIVEKNEPEPMVFMCGFGYSLPHYKVYAEGVIGYREGGESIEESEAPAGVLTLAQNRTDVIAEAMQAHFAEEQSDTTLHYLNPRHFSAIEPRVQKTQSIYPVTRPEGRFYRRAVRVALQY